MAAYKEAGQWRYRKRLPKRLGGIRISGTPEINSREAAEEAERAHIFRTEHPEAEPKPEPKEVTFEQFWDRYAREHLSWKKGFTQDTSKRIYEKWIRKAVGAFPLSRVATQIPTLRATIRDGLNLRGTDGHKTINNITAVVGSVLRFAESVGEIPQAPRLGHLPVSKPEMEWIEFDPYGRVVEAAFAEGYPWSVAIPLAGEAGLRVGEVQEARWREDVDMIAGSITVRRKNSDGRIEPTKGREQRTVPITSTLDAALRGTGRIREGLIVCHPDGRALTRKEVETGFKRVYRKAGVPVSGVHVLRHTFGTHAALLGVNPWKLQAWMAHKSIATTMGYVHNAEAHARPIPPHVLEAARSEADPDRRIVVMLGARWSGNSVNLANVRPMKAR